MKVLLVNGGAHPKGCTNRALEEVEKALKEEEIETLIYHIPNVPLQDCIACGTCACTRKNRTIRWYIHISTMKCLQLAKRRIHY